MERPAQTSGRGRVRPQTQTSQARPAQQHQAQGWGLGIHPAQTQVTACTSPWSQPWKALIPALSKLLPELRKASGADVSHFRKEKQGKTRTLCSERQRHVPQAEAHCILPPSNWGLTA